MRPCRCAVALVATLLLCLTSVNSQAQDSLEYAVKATFLYKFVPFVTWPNDDSALPRDVVSLCVVGHDPFGDLLDRAVLGQRIGDRQIVLERFATVQSPPSCHVMYVGGSETQSVAEALDVVRGQPVLTVTDAAHGSDAKGIIHFLVRDSRVRFEIDDAAAAANGLEISSKLLNLAVFVTPRARRG